MKWLEIIILRTAGAPKPSDDQFKALADSLSATGLVEAVFYKNASITGDLALALHWETEEPKPWGSDLALRLTQELKRRGLVDHSVWIKDGVQ